MNESIMPKSNSRPTLCGPMEAKMECVGNQLAMVKTEMVNQTMADGAISHSEWREKTSDNQSDCDNSVQAENEPNVGSPIANEPIGEKGAEVTDNRTADAKVPPNATRTKLIYSCHRCKLIFSSRISFESHYK